MCGCEWLSGAMGIAMGGCGWLCGPMGCYGWVWVAMYGLIYNNLHCNIIGIFTKRSIRTVYKIEIII